jgi:hypothetical protein
MAVLGVLGVVGVEREMGPGLDMAGSTIDRFVPGSGGKGVYCIGVLGSLLDSGGGGGGRSVCNLGVEAGEEAEMGVSRVLGGGLVDS